MRRVAVSGPVDLPPERAMALWTDLRRWPVFVEGFGSVLAGEREWPQLGGRLIWQSTPGGRGRVTERVVDVIPGERIVTQVFEQQLVGTQSVTFAPLGDGPGAHVELALDYELAMGSPLKGVLDVVFIRRALQSSLTRTLGRFAIEAAEDARL